jgi:hypothetical protein
MGGRWAHHKIVAMDPFGHVTTVKKRKKEKRLMWMDMDDWMDGWMDGL